MRAGPNGPVQVLLGMCAQSGCALNAHRHSGSAQPPFRPRCVGAHGSRCPACRRTCAARNPQMGAWPCRERWRKSASRHGGGQRRRSRGAAGWRSGNVACSVHLGGPSVFPSKGVTAAERVGNYMQESHGSILALRSRWKRGKKTVHEGEASGIGASARRGALALATSMTREINTKPRCDFRI